MPADFEPRLPPRHSPAPSALSVPEVGVSGPIGSRALSYPRAILWGFFGVRRRAGAQTEIEGLSPIVLIATGFVVAALLIALLLSLARWATAGL